MRRLVNQDAIFETIKESFHELPHLFITGPPGSGKTTFLYDFLDFCKKEAPFQIESVLWLTSEKDRGIHTIRDKVTDFCKRAHSKPNSLRFIFIDDADTLPLISQQALRRPMEQFVHLTRFIFVSRFSSHLMEPLRSRCLMLELEPLSPTDAFSSFTNLFQIEFDTSEEKEELFSFSIRNFTNLHEMKYILRIYKVYRFKGVSHSSTLTQLKELLPASNLHITHLLQALSARDEIKIRSSITELFYNGFLLDDILLGIEKGAFIYPSVDPESRFTILQFTMLGWISIQQGKEHWLDTMDIVNTILSSNPPI